jgi:hypothetical protein
VPCYKSIWRFAGLGSSPVIRTCNGERGLSSSSLCAWRNKHAKEKETYGVEILQEAFVDMSVSFTVICHPSPGSTIFCSYHGFLVLGHSNLLSKLRRWVHLGNKAKEQHSSNISLAPHKCTTPRGRKINKIVIWDEC